MKLVDDYFRLRSSFAQRNEGEAFPVTMAEIASALYCTNRNAKLILTKMEEQGWIQFVSGRGRGHMSALTFLKDKESLLQQEAQELVRVGETEAAFQLVKQFGDSHATARLVSWLSGYFGYRVEENSDQYVETLTLPIYRPITTLDPAAAVYAFDTHMVKQIFSTLVEYDDEAETVVGQLAHHWKSNAAATEWTFYVRKGVYFHHGRELTAADVAYSFRRLGQPSSRQHWLVQQIEAVEVVARYVVRFHLTHPNHLFLLYVGSAPASIVPQDVYESGNRVEQSLPIGCGPYRVAKYTAGMCVLDAFAQHFQGRPFMDQIQIISMPEKERQHMFEPRADVLMVHTGEAARQEVHNWNEAGRVSGSSLLTVNLNKQGIVANHDFRRALSGLINRQRMVAELGEPRLFPCDSFMEAASGPVLYESGADRSVSVDFLKRSGYAGETLHLFTYERHAPDVYWLQREYAAYGVMLAVHIVSWDDMLQDTYIAQADFILFEAVSSEGIIRQLEYYTSTSSFLRAHMNKSLRDEADRCVACVQAEREKEAQTRMLQHMENRLKEEHAVIFLTYKTVGVTSHPALQGVRVSPRGWVDFKNVWFES